MTNRFPHYDQPDSKDCEPSCLRIVAKYYGGVISIQKARQLSETVRIGRNILGLSNAAEAIGFKTIEIKGSLKKLEEALLLKKIVNTTIERNAIMILFNTSGKFNF